MSLKAPLLRADNIGVSFSGVSVLRGVTLEVNHGEILGLVGENGAGKSTLGKVLGGYYSLSEGVLYAGGEDVSGWKAHTALNHGIAMMHQEIQIVPALTVAQNVFLGFEDTKFGILKPNERQRLKQLMSETGFFLNPAIVTSDLPIADQQKVEILRSLARKAQMIVMDEPTSSLTKDEITQLHEIMKKLKERGTAIIYISHFLDDILDVCDRIAVLRDGSHVATLDRNKISKPDLVAAILGTGQTETQYPKKSPPKTRKKILDVSGLTSPNGTKNVTFEVHENEIVGLIGFVGSGRTEIARALVGADTSTDGKVKLYTSDYSNRTPAKSTERGLVMVPEDRRGQGLVITLPVRANVTLPHLQSYTAGGVILTQKERSKTEEIIDFFDIRPTVIDGDVTNYSGGNQQKILIGKWLAESPKIVILDEPSRGVDIGAREKIHRSIVELAASGASFILISSEIEEVLGLAHRAYLVNDGQIKAEILPDETTERDVLNTLFSFQ